MAFSPQEVAAYKELFDSVDDNGSGELDRDEVWALLRQTGEEVEEEKVEEIMRRVDTSGDGTIDFDEFLHFLEVLKHEGTEAGSECAGLGALRSFARALNTKQEEARLHQLEREELLNSRRRRAEIARLQEEAEAARLAALRDSHASDERARRERFAADQEAARRAFEAAQEEMHKQAEEDDAHRAEARARHLKVSRARVRHLFHVRMCMLRLILAGGAAVSPVG